MKKSEIIVMLTYKDYTVSNAKQVFDTCVDLKVKYWGCKDNVLSDDEMIALGRRIKDCGKTPVLELVNFTKEAYERAAKLAVNGRFGLVSGGLYNAALWKTLKDNNIMYMPFCGELVRDEMGWFWMHETREEQAKLIKEALAAGCYGIDYCCYRHAKDTGEELVRWFKKEFSDVPVTAAGGVNTLERIAFLCHNDVDYFTTGSALFGQKYVENGSFYDNLKYIYDYIQALK